MKDKTAMNIKDADIVEKLRMRKTTFSDICAERIERLTSDLARVTYERDELKKKRG